MNEIRNYVASVTEYFTAQLGGFLVEVYEMGSKRSKALHQFEKTISYISYRSIDWR